MNELKVAVIYYSMTGTNYTMAKWAAQKARTLGAQVRLLKVAELAPAEVIAKNPVWQAQVEAAGDVAVASVADLEWADAIVFSTPTRFGNMASQMKQFIDQTGGLWAKGKTVNKVVTAMTSAQNPHGGQEATLLGLYTSMYHWGAIVVTPGYSDSSVFKAGGNPYGTSVSVDHNGAMVEDVRDAVEYQVQRTLDIAKKLKG